MLTFQFGEYKVEAVLGIGSMGCVYKARSEGGKKAVALKVVMNPTPTKKALFEDEWGVGSLCVHPHIVRMRSRGVDGDNHYIAMSFVDGENLREVLKHGPMPALAALEVLRQLCLALQYIHSLRDKNGPLGVVYKDLKPDNLVLRSSGHVTLVDFSISQFRDCKWRPKNDEVLGTIVYMAPEQVLSQKLEQASDIFVVGSLLIELLTGKFAFFHPEHIRGTMEQILWCENPSDRRLEQQAKIETIHSVLWDIVLSCHRVYPHERPKNAEVLRRMIKKARETLLRELPANSPHRESLASFAERTVSAIRGYINTA